MAALLPFTRVRPDALIVHGQPVFRRGLRIILAPFVGDVLEAHTAPDVRRLLEGGPGVVLLGLGTPGLSMSMIARTKRLAPHIRVFVIARERRDPRLVEAIRAGADGFILEDDPADAVVELVAGLFDNPPRGRRQRTSPHGQRIEHHLDRIERLCWQRKYPQSARVLSALKLALIGCAYGSWRARDAYLPRLARACEALQREFMQAEIRDLEASS